MPKRSTSAVKLGETEFEKEVWLSGVMLTWGSAGQIVTVDDRPVGFALFAPPTAVPGAAAFPTSPVSPDAVLLTTAKILPEFTGQGLARYLMNGVVNALTRRGVRAIEVFGLESDPMPDPVDLQAAPVEPAPDPGLPRCLLPAGFARAVGFEDVAPHSPLSPTAFRARPGHRLEGGGGVGAGETVHRDHVSRPRRPRWCRSSSASADGPIFHRRFRDIAIRDESDTTRPTAARCGGGAAQAESRMVRSCASRSEKVKVPVCGSSRPSRYSRFTATSSPSASRLRNSSDVRRSRSAGLER